MGLLPSNFLCCLGGLGPAHPKKRLRHRDHRGQKTDEPSSRWSPPCSHKGLHLLLETAAKGPPSSAHVSKLAHAPLVNGSSGHFFARAARVVPACLHLVFLAPTLLFENECLNFCLSLVVLFRNATKFAMARSAVLGAVLQAWIDLAVARST